METQQETRDDLVLGPCTYEDETLTADLTGTAATITDTTTYAVDDQSGKTEKVTINDGSGEAWDGVEQTVTFSGATTTAASVAAQMNDGLDGCGVAVVGGQVKITTDVTGPDSSIEIGTGTCDLTWDNPVAGTGQSATWPKGTLLARHSSTKKLQPYADGGANSLDEPVAVLREALTFAASGDLQTRVIKSGKLAKNKLSKLDDATAIDTLVFDKLLKNTGIELQTVRDLSVSEIS